MDSIQSHILYLEDHEDTRELVTLVLSDCNFRVTTASGSSEALKLAGDMHFDLYILDSKLPDGSGIDLCKRLREFDSRTPIMFLSAAAYEADKQAAFESGAQRYLVKPNDIHAVGYEATALILGFANEQAEAPSVVTSHGIPIDQEKTGSSRSIEELTLSQAVGAS